MIRRTQRPMTDAEWSELSASRIEKPHRAVHERVLGIVKWSVVTAFCLGMGGACYLGSTGMTGATKVVTLTGMALLGLGALGALGMVVRDLLPARGRTVPPVVTDRSTPWSVVEMDALEAWQIETGDDDVPTLLVRVAEGKYVSICGQVLDELWESDDDHAWHSIGATIRYETLHDLERVSSDGPRVEIRRCKLAEPWPSRGTPWWAKPFVELTSRQLGSAWLAALSRSASTRT